MSLLAVKLVVAPLLLLAATLVQRRWGASIGGFVVGLPLTSGPVSVFLALEQGPAFATQATSGSLVATAAQAAFGLAYCRLAGRGWPLALAAASAAFVVAAVVVQRGGLPHAALFALAVAAVAVAWRLCPRAGVARRRIASPWWDLPARVLLLVGLIVGVTTAAPVVGPEASGVLAAYPVMGVILTVFAHRMDGPGAGQQVMAGMVAGLFGFAVFFFALGLALPRTGLVAAYAGALAAALAAQGLALGRVRRLARGEVPGRSE